MRQIIALWLAALMFVAQPVQAAVCVGFGQSAGGSSCISGTYILGWGGEWASDTDKACATSGDTTGVDGTVGGSPDISTTYGEGGADVALTADANGEYITWTDSGGTYVDLNGARTLWLRIYISAAPTGVTRILDAQYDGSNYVKMEVNASREIICTHRAGATIQSAYGDAVISTATWVDVAYTWDRPNQDHAVNTDGTWDEDLNELSADGTDITAIRIGSYFGFSMGAGENIRITNFVVVNGYRAAKPW